MQSWLIFWDNRGIECVKDVNEMFVVSRTVCMEWYWWELFTFATFTRESIEGMEASEIWRWRVNRPGLWLACVSSNLIWWVLQTPHLLCQISLKLQKKTCMVVSAKNLQVSIRKQPAFIMQTKKREIGISFNLKVLKSDCIRIGSKTMKSAI